MAVERIAEVARYSTLFADNVPMSVKTTVISGVHLMSSDFELDLI